MSSSSNSQTLEENNIFEIHSTQELKTHLKKAKANATILFDIDDTLITPISCHFRKDPHKQLIDHIKKNKHLYTNYEEIVSNWRLQRKVMLVDNALPDIIHELKKTHSVYGLTKLDTGKFGNIASMERWRYQELKSLNIAFSDNIAINPDKETEKNTLNNPVFIHGIFITGSKSKHETLDYFHSHLNAKQIVFIDDRIEHILDVKKYCDKHHIPFLGLLYKGVEQLSGTANHKIVELQKEHLLKHAQWLEDEDAKKLLKD